MRGGKNMTEKELVKTLSKEGFTETTISPIQNKRTFTATDIYGKEITITFDKGKDSYDKVSMKVSDEIIQTPINVEIKRLNDIKIQQPESLPTEEDEQEEPTAAEGNLIDVPDPPDPTEFKKDKEEGDGSKFSFDIHDISTKANSFTTSLVDTAKNNISNFLSNQEEATFKAYAYESFKNLNI